MDISNGIHKQVSDIKDDMAQILTNMHADNVDDCSALLVAQLAVIQGLYKIEKMKGELGIQRERLSESSELDSTAVHALAIDEPVPVGTGISLQQELPTESLDRPMYRVERKLKGAYVNEIEGFIPESILRNMGIEHGDYVYAESIPAVKAGQNRFRYELAEKSDVGSAPGRIEFKGCLVKKDGDLLVLKKSLVTGKSIKLNDYPYAIVLSDRDIVQFELTEGDVVDVALYENQPTAASVIWKHEVAEELFSEKPELKKSTPKKEVETVDEVIDPVFAGQTICLIGDKPNESLYKAMVEERGGKLLHVEPKWNVRRIQTHVKNADVVVGLYDLSKHTGLEKAKAYCKQYDKPYKMIPGKGKSTVLQTALELLQETS